MPSRRGSSSDAVGRLALGITLGAWRAPARSGIAPNLAYLASVACLAGPGRHRQALLDGARKVAGTRTLDLYRLLVGGGIDWALKRRHPPQMCATFCVVNRGF